MEQLFDLVSIWGTEKGIVKPDNQYTQLAKVLEELGELSASILKQDRDKEVDSFGDLLVTIKLLADIRGVDLKYALGAAYNEIKERKGSMVGGTFIKEV